MKYLILLLLPFALFACESRLLNTAQPLQVDLVGVDEAYCILSTKYNRYALSAPDTASVERSPEDLHIDCQGEGRRRVVTVEPNFDGLYYRYPEEVTVDFSIVNLTNRFNGYQAQLRLPESSGVKSVLTERSFVAPVETKQDYPVKRRYYMDAKSYPVPLQ